MQLNKSKDKIDMRGCVCALALSLALPILLWAIDYFI